MEGEQIELVVSSCQGVIHGNKVGDYRLGMDVVKIARRVF